MVSLHLITQTLLRVSCPAAASTYFVVGAEDDSSGVQRSTEWAVSPRLL